MAAAGSAGSLGRAQAELHPHVLLWLWFSFCLTPRLALVSMLGGVDSSFVQKVLF